MESQKEYNFEQLMANRFNLENEYNSIKTIIDNHTQKDFSYFS